MLKKIISLLLVVSALTIFPFQSEPFKLFLKTGDNQPLQIPALQQCSCQLVAFPVLKKQYWIIVDVANNNTYNNVKLYIQSTKSCNVSTLIFNNATKSRQASLYVNSTQYENETAITQVIYVELISEPVGQCQGFKTQGYERSVYLIDREAEKTISYYMTLPFYSLIVTQVLAFLLLCLLCQNIKYRRVRPLTFGWIFAIIYTLILFVAVYIQSFFEQVHQIVYWITNTFSFLCMVLYFYDIASVFLDKVPAIFAVSLFISLLLAGLDFVVMPNAWFLNDIIAICVAGAIIKFIVVKKLKSASLPLFFFWIFFVLMQFLIQFHIQDFEHVLKIKIINIFLQIPGIFGDDHKGYKCSAFGTSKIITMGLLFNYVVRVDLFLSIKFYSRLVGFLAFVCLGFELVLQLACDQIPIMEYNSVILFLPSAMILVFLFAYKRGQWAQIWHGSFHDMAVDRKSIQKQESLLENDNLSRNLEENLRINKQKLEQ